MSNVCIICVINAIKQLEIQLKYNILLMLLCYQTRETGRSHHRAPLLSDQGDTSLVGSKINLTNLRELGMQFHKSVCMTVALLVRHTWFT